MVIAPDALLLQHVLNKEPKEDRWMAIDNYCFGWNDGLPAHEIDLRAYYEIIQGNAYVTRVECENDLGRWVRLTLPAKVMLDIEREVQTELRLRARIAEDV